MAPRTIYLNSTRSSKTQRAHFAIWVPSAQQPTSGSLINVVGAPMIGFAHEFKRCYEPAKSTEPYEMWPIGEVDSVHIFDWPEGGCSIRTDPKGDLEIAAAQVPAPGISRDFMAPVNDLRRDILGVRRLKLFSLSVTILLMGLAYGELLRSWGTDVEERSGDVGICNSVS
ncbi:hypothetical protein P875_00042401 [Aspergillus parasiticus SU-1]|uniref:Uncharacterized protein n=1 Tax=Aspergillus parasiticus (strain ATCC 56775 / NRRL 5862 / SRRC 143 / SU-1) TaxID=1403190 RepID=A0A0F0I0Q3_ASPPU|nr:hypothetical protein P875_00042401 [Aspergillus parasiticus SU-1]